MKAFSSKMNTKGKLISGIMAAAIAVLVLVFLILRNPVPSVSSADLKNGRAYLESLENFGVDNVVLSIKNAQLKKHAAEVDTALAQIDSGEMDVWSLFGDSVILGDSRADDFQYFGFLPSSRILADMGALSTDATQYRQTAVDLWPTRVFFTYGLNDVDGCWGSAEEFTSAYKEVIQSFMYDLPYADFYVCSILPVTEGARERDSNFIELPDYNAALKQMTADLGLTYIDCDHILDGIEDLYADDGQHFCSSFYPIWGKMLAKAALMNDAGLLESGVYDGTNTTLRTADSTGESESVVDEE